MLWLNDEDYAMRSNYYQTTLTSGSYGILSPWENRKLRDCRMKEQIVEHYRDLANQANQESGGGIRKIGEVPAPCFDPGHDFPSAIALPPGVYENTCPGCGRKTKATVTHTVS